MCSRALFVTFDTFTSLRKAANPDATMVWPSAVAVIPAPGVSPKALADSINAAVPQVTALTRSDAVADAPGVSSTQGSFALLLTLAVVVVALVTGFFFLILTAQKTAALTLLRAVGAPASYLVRGLIQQVVLVLGVALLVAVGLLVLATAAVEHRPSAGHRPARTRRQHGRGRGPFAARGGLLGVARAAHRSVSGRWPPRARRHRMKVALLELRRRPWRFAPAVIALVLLTGLLLTLGGLLDGLYNGFTGALRAQPGALLTYASRRQPVGGPLADRRSDDSPGRARAGCRAGGRPRDCPARRQGTGPDHGGQRGALRLSARTARCSRAARRRPARSMRTPA